MLRAPLIQLNYTLKHWKSTFSYLCGVDVCAWARVSAAPRNSLRGCWGVCVFVCVLLLQPATPGCVGQCGCVCLGSGFGCAPPVLAGLFGCVCVCVRAPFVPCRSWLGCAVLVCALWLGFRLRPATAGWGVRLCVCLCAGFACAPPLLAGLVGVRVCAWGRVSAAPRHSWLGCWGVCVFVCALCLDPATLGGGVRSGCVCFGSGFGCAPPLLAGVLGCLCVCVRALPLPRHSWRGCAVWVCVFGLWFWLRPATPGWGLWGVCVFVSTLRFVPCRSWLWWSVWVCVLGLGFRLRPSTPGWGVGVCVCLCVRSACTLPLLAAVCGVGVCAWARVSAAPHHSRLGRRAVCVFVCALRLCPATPGWGGRCACVCLGSGVGCAPPLLAGVLGCVCVCVRALPVPRHFWRWCAVWVCVFGLWLRLRPATPGWGLRGVCVFVGALRLYPAAPGCGGQCGCVCLGSGFGCASALLAGVLGCVCVCVRALLVPCRSWLRCAVLVCVLGLGFRLRPTTPGWDVWLCVCLCARFACAPPLLAGVVGVRVCAWGRVSAAPRHSWLGCWGVCVFVCALCLDPATPGGGVRSVCVCFGSGFGCAPPLLAGVLGCVCVCVHALPVPRHSWRGCAVWVCVFGLWFRLRPATPWLGSLGCVCVCEHAPFVPCRSRLWWSVWVCVLGLRFRLRPATPGWAGRCACVCLRSGVGCAPPLLAGVLGCLCVCVRALLGPRHSWRGCAVWVCVFWLWLRLRPATPGWGVGVCVCLCARSASTPPLLAGLCGLGVCVWALVSAASRHSWLGSLGCVCVCEHASFCTLPLLAVVVSVSVCLLGLGFRLRPSTPGWGVGVCVCLCVRSACTLPLLAAVCGVGVCAWARVSAAPHHSRLGRLAVCVFVCALRLCPATPGWGGRCACVCLGSGVGCAPPLLAGVFGCLCVCVRALLGPRHSWRGCAVWVCVFWLWFRLRPATPGTGVGVCVCLCARSACTPPLLAVVCGLGVCVWSLVAAASRHSWLGSLGCLCVCGRAPFVPCRSWLWWSVWVCVLGLGFRLRVSTPGLGVGVCVCLCARSACTLPLLAALCGVGVCAWARVSAAPHHSWLGCPAMCVFVCALRLCPATPGWGGRCACVCLGSGVSCAPPLLAGVLGLLCVCVRTLLGPRHSWRGCAVCVCVFWLWFRLRPATPGWGVGVCVRLCARSACTPPLLAGVCGLGVCVWALVSAASCNSWLGSLGCVCVCERAPFVPCHSWLWWSVWVCVLGLRFRLRVSTPGWGVCVCVCFCARSACTLSLLAAVCGVGVCAWARVSAAPHHPWLGCPAVYEFVCALRLCPATPGGGLRLVCVTLGSGFGCASPLLAWVLGCVCVCVRAPLPPRHSWLGWFVCLFVLGLWCRLRPATPGWGVGVCVCFCARSACTPPLLAGLCGLGVCVWALVSAAPRHSPLGCWGVCVFVCAVRLYRATPGGGVRCQGVCLGSGFGCVPPLLARLFGCVCVCVRAQLPLQHSWLWWSVWVCVLGLGFRLRPATPGLCVGVCV